MDALGAYPPGIGNGRLQAIRARHILLDSYDIMHRSVKCIDWEGWNACVSKTYRAWPNA